MFKNHNNDQTVNREYVKRVKALIQEYELVKARRHPHFKFASDLFHARAIPRQTFYKYYSKLQSSGTILPGKRGPKNPHRRYPAITNAILKAREAGFSRFEIHRQLAPVLKRLTPGPTTIYNICKAHNLNRLRPEQKRCRRMIIKEHAGELVHFDSYHLPRGLVKDSGKLYLIGAIDDATRVAWVEVMPDITALSAMFGGMQILRLLQDRYGIAAKAVMTDNGAEFKNAKNPMKHPFERLLRMLEAKHYYTKPYRPQPNGKIERFWRTLYEDLLEEAEFETTDKLREELQGYMLYYNEHRPHQSLENKTPAETAKQISNICPRIA
ncbi:MAG: integrase core domain-containing protein [Bacteroidales bacterium]|jgi:transposase InsO family protein|nr:integrase core domain-containing protein [Bacteroidales bacterium]